MNAKRIKILLVEDNPGDARLIREMLNEADAQFDLELADRLSTAFDRLSADGFDLILLDLGLPDSQGLETFTKTQRQAPRTPVVILTVLDDEAVAIRAVRESAQDYLVKARLDTNLLERAIRYAVERKQASETLQESEEKYAG